MIRITAILMLIASHASAQRLPIRIGQNGAAITYATWNTATKSANITFSNGNLTFTGTQGAPSGFSTATIGKSSGKWYWEITVNSFGGSGVPGNSRNLAGVSSTVPALNNSTGEIGALPNTAGMRGNAFNTAVWYNFGSFQNLGSFTTDWAVGSVLSYALDMTGGTLQIYLDGVYVGTSIPVPAGTFYPACGSDGQGLSATANFGQNAWSTNATVTTTRNTLAAAGYNLGVY